jgi:hypothetical protein
MSAVLLIIFNRPSTTQLVFNVLRLAQPSRLYIAADGPRQNNSNDEDNIKLTRAITEQIDWPCEVKRLYQENNLGCNLGPRTAFDWFFSHEPEGIILEDDCIPHIEFFSFASQMLERYRHNHDIISINGSNLGFRLNNGVSYTFSRFMNMWGWATWANRAKLIDYTLAEWKLVKYPIWFLYRHLNQYLFDTDIHWFKYWKHKFDLTVTQDLISWWDWQWIYHQITHHKLSIVPAVNLVSNVGFNEDATHTSEGDNPAANIPAHSIDSAIIHPQKIIANLDNEEKYVKWVWCYHKRINLFDFIKGKISSKHQ